MLLSGVERGRLPCPKLAGSADLWLAADLSKDVAQVSYYHLFYYDYCYYY